MLFAPATPIGGWFVKTPIFIGSTDTDPIVSPWWVKALFDELLVEDKMFIKMIC